MGVVFSTSGNFDKRAISIYSFVSTGYLFSPESLPTLRYTAQPVLLPLSIVSIVLSLPSITGTTVDPSGKYSWDVLAMSNEVLIARQIRSTLELTLLTGYPL
jgi:hypothetical protein